MRLEDWEAEQMKNPEFRAALKKLQRRTKYFGWYYYLEAWVDYILDWVWERISKEE